MKAVFSVSLHAAQARLQRAVTTLSATPADATKVFRPLRLYSQLRGGQRKTEGSSLSDSPNLNRQPCGAAYVVTNSIRQLDELVCHLENSCFALKYYFVRPLTDRRRFRGQATRIDESILNFFYEE